MKKKYKCLNLDDYILPGYEEITGDALYRINGGGRIEPEENQNPPEEGSSSSDNYTVQSGDTLSQIVYDYNQANGTHLTVDEVAALSGIDNPDLILPGQSIVFSNPEQGGETGQPVDPTNPAGSTSTSSNPSSTSSGNSSANSGVTVPDVPFPTCTAAEMAAAQGAAMNAFIDNNTTKIIQHNTSDQYEMAQKDLQKNGNSRIGVENGLQAGYVADLDGAKGMGHAGWFVQTANNKYSFFEITGLSEKSNNINENTIVGTKLKDKWGTETIVLSNSSLSFPSPDSANSSGMATRAGCLLRNFDSKEEMEDTLRRMGFDEVIIVNRNSIQNNYIYEASLKSGMDFKNYNLLNNSCGIVARDTLTVDGGGISSWNPYTNINFLFSSSIPNQIGANLILANKNCYVEDLRK